MHAFPLAAKGRQQFQLAYHSASSEITIWDHLLSKLSNTIYRSPDVWSMGNMSPFPEKLKNGISKF
jgi:hypothetical protein